MKNYILLLIAMLSLNVFAQQYESIFGEESTSIQVASGGGSMITTSPLPLFFDDYLDTLGVRFFGSTDYFGQSENHDRLFRLTELGGGYRFDTIMNLNLEIGDKLELKGYVGTFLNGSLDETSYPPTTQVVAKYESEGRLIIEFGAIIKVDYGLQVPLRYIEGVGPNLGWNINRKDLHNITQLITCVHKNGEQVYMEPSLDSCEYFGFNGNAVEGVIERSGMIEKVLIKNGMLTCKFYKPGNYQISIKDIAGRILNTFTCNNSIEFTSKVSSTDKFLILSVYDKEKGIVWNQKIINLPL